MKRIRLLLLVLVLAACSTPAPTAAPAQPTQTPLVVVETVVQKVVETVIVTVVPTQPPTEAPSATPLPPPTEAQPTAVPAQPTQPPAEAAAPTAPAGGPIAVDEALGAGWFTAMTRTRSDFALRCQLSKEITFSVKPLDPNIARVDFYYRIGDRATGAVFDWQNAGRMFANADGSFSLTFSGEDVHVNFRKPNAWFDYQFIGLSRSGGVVGRSEKIVQQVTYSLDCP